jgi:DNA-binding CsgD family transcriptional regulator
MPRAYARANARVMEICQSANDERTLRQQVIEELQPVLGFESYAWLVTDPATSVGASPLADVPWLPDLPRQIELKYRTTVNRWTALEEAPVALLDQATGGDLAQSLVWRELLVRHGVRDVASVIFKDRFGCWAFLELWRTGTTVPFSAAEASLLADLAAPLTLALRRCLGSSFVPASGREFPHVGPIVMLLSPQLQVRGQTPNTTDIDLFARVFGLSTREHELLEHLLAGRTTRELARCMWLSENTVQDHFKSIFAKTSSRSRQALLARAIGS